MRAGPASLRCQVCAAAWQLLRAAQHTAREALTQQQLQSRMQPGCADRRPARLFLFLLLSAVWRLSELGGPYDMDPGFLYDGMRK